MCSQQLLPAPGKTFVQMNSHTTNYYNTFIEVAEDCPVTAAEVPPQKGEEKSVAALQFDMLHQNPYQYTSDDVLFQIHAQRNGIAEGDLAAEHQRFFSKGQPCFRSSPLAKRYGWGIHCDGAGKIALLAIDSDSYQKCLHDKNLKVVKAMRSKRK
jgi:hypothetical protein